MLVFNLKLYRLRHEYLMKKSQRFRFVSFCLIFMILFCWMNHLFSYANQGWRDFYRLPQNSVDVIFMGNSHNISTFQPRIVDDLLPVDSYLVGIGGENIILSYYELKEVLKTQHPKVVVLESFTMNLSEIFVPAFIFGFVDAGAWNNIRSAIVKRYLPVEQYYTLLPILRTRIDWNSPSHFLLKFHDPFRFLNRDIDSKQGFGPINMVLTKEEFDEGLNLHTLNSIALTEELNLYFEKIVELCQENNIQLILCVAPTVVIWGERFVFYVPFDPDVTARQYDLEIIRISDEDFNELHFSNFDHVSSFGSINASLEMADALANLLDLPLDELSLEYYRSMLFSGYSLNHQGAEYTLALYPVDKNAPLEYRYLLKEIKTNKTLGSTDWSPDPMVSYSLPAPGKYSIEVEIRNCLRDYGFSSIFQISYEGNNN